MSEILETHVSRVFRPGPKAKAVNLGKVTEGDTEVRLWTFVDKDEVVVPGMTFSCESVSFGALQTSYTKKDENGNSVEEQLQVPKRQVFCHIKANIDAPESKPVTTEVVVTDAAREYAERYLAAQAKAEADDGEEPF